MLKDRLRQIIDQQWQGNVAAAASEIGVPQQTMQRIAAGDTRNPRASVLARIAFHSVTTVEWLLTGTGAPPPANTPHGIPEDSHSIRWRRLVGALGLSDGARRLVELLPMGPFNLAFTVEMLNDLTEMKDPDWVRPLSASIHEVWADVLGELIRRNGAKIVRDRLERGTALQACGYSVFSMWAVVHQGAAMQSLLSKFVDATGLAPEEAPSSPKRSRTSVAKQETKPTVPRGKVQKRSK